MRVLQLVQHITGYGVQCVVDLLSQVDINSRGGLANWLPYSIRNTDKILVIVNQDYLRVSSCIIIKAMHFRRPELLSSMERSCSSVRCISYYFQYSTLALIQRRTDADNVVTALK